MIASEDGERVGTDFIRNITVRCDTVSSDDDSIEAGAGNDSIVAGAGNDTVNAGEGDFCSCRYSATGGSASAASRNVSTYDAASVAASGVWSRIDLNVCVRRRTT